MRLLRRIFVILSLGLLVSLGGIHAQDGDPLAPEQIDGEIIYAPFPVAITLDGDSSDWAGVSSQTVERGTQLSSDPAENGSFSFSVAADAENIYLLITMPDLNIVTGQHGSDYWNEDSLEVYFNFSGDLAAEAYTAGVHQINIKPLDIGNTDPAALNITGNGGAAAGLTGFVFAIDGGWGIEAAVPLPFTPEHGTEIGFQAQANGATDVNRDVKLIWSLADTSDTSWQNPSLFGRILFYEIGRDDIPQPSQPAEPEEELVVVRAITAVNQVGYFVGGVKHAVHGREEALRGQPTWTIKDAASGDLAFAGVTAAAEEDVASGDFVYRVDFSAFDVPGTYILSVDGVDSQPFTIAENIYGQLKIDALRYFYLTRSGTPLEAEFAGEAYARPAGHVSDGDVTCFSGEAAGQTFEPCAYRLNAAGGWYDAGDYGKYVVNGGIALWTLLNTYERNPEGYADGALNLPESGNGVPDILDESRWQMEWMLSMQVPDDAPLAGMVHHKLHALNWDGLPVLPPTEVDNANPTNGRMLMPPSTAATYNMAATAAQCARIWREIDAEFAQTCLDAAEKAWRAGQDNPIMTYGNIPGNGGGNYDNADTSDEFYWATAELYITTGNEEYLNALVESDHFTGMETMANANASVMYWGDTAALGTISLVTTPNGLTTEQLDGLRAGIIAAADIYLERVASEGYGVPITAQQYFWGSNSSVLNNAMLMALAYTFTDDVKYHEGVVRSMDYILGMNANNFSFVSGYGGAAMTNPHHRFWANLSGFPPPPPGVIAGGPNGSPADDYAIREIGELPTSRRYVDHVDSYSTNEVAINWNAPLVWVAAYLSDMAEM